MGGTIPGVLQILFHIVLVISLQSQFSHSVVSDSLQPHELQHARSPCPSATPGVHSNSRPLSQWCHPTISSSVTPFSSCPQSLPASESFPMSQLFAWGGQSTGVSALAPLLLKNTQDWSPLEWTGRFILLLFKNPEFTEMAKFMEKWYLSQFITHWHLRVETACLEWADQIYSTLWCLQLFHFARLYIVTCEWCDGSRAKSLVHLMDQVRNLVITFV